jgi:hypothetical protein
LRERRRFYCHVSELSDSRRVAARRHALDQPTHLGTNFSVMLRSERPATATIATILVTAANSVRSAESPLTVHAIILIT